jgi:hypothetical protein
VLKLGRSLAAWTDSHLRALPKWPLRSALYAVLACGVTWPLLLRLNTHIPIGTEASATVPLFNVWTLLWNTDRLAHLYANYWNAPIFYPTPGAFALSEPQPLTGLFFSAVFLVARNPALAYNLVLLASLTLNGLAAHLLFTRLGLDHTPALLGGLLAVSLPFVFNELGVLQLTTLAPIFMTLAMLVTFARHGDRRSAIGLGIWVAATFLTCEYYGLFLTLFIGLAAVLSIRRSHVAWTPARRLLAGLIVSGLILLLVLPAQRSFTHRYTRSATTIKANSAEAGDYFRVSRASLGRGLTPWVKVGGGERFYPGTVVVGLGLMGGLEAWRRRQRRWMLFCVLGAALAFILSLGVNLQVAGFRPYDLLHTYYPGFRQLRSPFRLAVFVQILLVGLAGFGVACGWRPNRLRRGLVVGLVVAGVLETLVAPIRLSAFPFAQLDQPWIKWLAGQPPGAVAMAPFPKSGQVRDYESTTVAMLQALEHGHPLVNGYSGFFPSSYLTLRRAMQSFPDSKSVQLALDSGVQYLVVERAWLTESRSARLTAYPFQLLFTDAEVWIYGVIEP